MKSLALVLSLAARPFRRRDTRVFIWLVLGLVVMVALYSAIFHVIMEWEGQRYSWPTAVYWTIVTMSTLGFGDITFTSDTGRLFSVVVLVTGAMFILVLIPFAFIQFVFLPWMERRERARAPRRLPPSTSGHIVLTQLGAVTSSLIRRADDAQVPYVVVVPDLDDALRMVDDGRRVMVGELDDPETYRRAQVEQAALVATTQADTTNTNVAYTVREITGTVPIVATATRAASVDVLELAGCDAVLELGELLGTAMARRVLGGDRRAHVVGEFDELLVAEAGPAGTDLVGSTLAAADLRRRVGINVAGLWRRGEFSLPSPDTEIDPTDVLILAGSREQLDGYDAAFGAAHGSTAPTMVLGGGRVGRAAARVMAAAGSACTIVEQQPERVRGGQRYVVGDAAELDVLNEAGLADAGAVLITTHDDDVNVYLTIYCRRLRPDVQVIARANADRNVATLHRAGADAVLSYASIGATAIWNNLGMDDALVIAEGLEMFRTPVPPGVAGRTLAELDLRRRTGCNVVAVARRSSLATNPDPTVELPGDAELVLIADEDGRHRFLEAYPAGRG